MRQKRSGRLVRPNQRSDDPNASGQIGQVLTYGPLRAHARARIRPISEHPSNLSISAPWCSRRLLKGSVKKPAPLIRRVFRLRSGSYAALCKEFKKLFRWDLPDVPVDLVLDEPLLAEFLGSARFQEG